MDFGRNRSLNLANVEGCYAASAKGDVQFSFDPPFVLCLSLDRCTFSFSARGNHTPMFVVEQDGRDFRIACDVFLARKSGCGVNMVAGDVSTVYADLVTPCILGTSPGSRIAYDTPLLPWLAKALHAYIHLYLNVVPTSSAIASDLVVPLYGFRVSQVDFMLGREGKEKHEVHYKRDKAAASLHHVSYGLRSPGRALAAR